MVKQASSSSRQRKTRLDKAGEKTEFIGFGAFAASASPQQLPSASQTESASVSYQWSPIYSSPLSTEHDNSSSTQQQQQLLSLLFTRMAQKRDPITVGKAVQEWEQSYLLSSDVSKPVKAHALKHYAWLYARRLYWENSSQVRAAAFRVWLQAVPILPRVVTGLVLEQPVLLGLFCAARSDPDVGSTLQQQQHSGDVSLLFGNKDWPWQQGLLEHSSTVLSYGRASALQEALFPSNKSTSTNDSTDPKRLEQNRDAQEERWERAVATCLGALTRWIQQQNGDDDDDASSSMSEACQLWWKTMSSPKARLRRYTYQLLSAVTLKAPHLLLQHIHLSNALSQAVASEKEAVNVPVLLETVLSVLVQQRKSSNPQENFQALATALSKPLIKAWRKANYGASVTVWGPMMLPLVAQFPTTAQQVQLLQAAHEGQQWVLGHDQHYLLLQAIAESALFVLLRQRVQDSGDGDDDNGNRNQNAQALAQIWLTVFQSVVLSSTWSNHNAKARPSSVNNRVLHVLVRDLAKQLVQFGCAVVQSSSTVYNLFLVVQEWFWEHGLTLLPVGGDVNDDDDGNASPVLVQLLKELIQLDAEGSGGNSSSNNMPTRLCPQLRQRFQYQVARFEPRGGEAVKSPALSTVAEYGLLDALLEYGGPMAVLTNEESLVKFVLNDLLRWTVIHTSTLSEKNSKAATLVEQDFGLLSRCLAAITSKRSSVWEAFLREIISAKCDLTCLVNGLQALVDRGLHQNHDTSSWMRCDTLDKFAVEIGQGSRDDELAAHLGASSSDYEEESLETTHTQDAVYESKLLFFTTCLGVTSDTAPCLVDCSIVARWVENVTTATYTEEWEVHDAGGALLESLLQTLQKKRQLLTGDEADRLVLQAWYCTESFFEAYATAILLQASDLRTRFIHQAACQTREKLNGFVHGANLIVESWAIQAWRLVKLCQDSELPFPSIGFDDLNIWSGHPDIMFSLSMSLMDKIETKSDRLRLVQSWKNGANDSPATILHILVSLSEASSHDVLAAAKAKTRCDRCAKFLDAIGGSSLAVSDVVEWVGALISRMSTLFDSSETDDMSCNPIQEVAVLSQLLSLMFQPVSLTGMDAIEAETVNEGDRLWYISDPTMPAVREEVEVAKVHYDVQAGYYFTIRVDRDGGSQERQTVLDRLRKTKSSHSSRGCMPVDCISENELSKRSELLVLLMQKLIMHNSSKIARYPSLGELVGLSIGHLGVGKDRGLGSSHYNIHRCLSSAEQAVRTSIQEGGVGSGRDGLWSLSLASGLGLCVPATTGIVKYFHINPFPLYTLLLSHYSASTADTSLPNDCATVAWLIVSIDAALDYCKEFGKDVIQATILLFSLASRILKTEEKSNPDFSGPEVMACRAIQVGLEVRNQTRFKQIIPDDEDAKKLSEVTQESFDVLIRRFAVGWKCPATSSVPAWTAFSVFPEIVSSSLAHEFLASSGSKSAGVLSELLYEPSKRYHSFLVLDKVALRAKVLQGVDDVSLADSTSRRLQSWVDGLEGEEAAEIEEDVYIVAEWAPSAMMVEVESWAERDSESDEVVVAGRFLTWLVFLRFVDSATPKDFRNRPAFVSYLKRCGAVRSVLELALWYSETINDRKRKTSPSLLDMAPLLKDESLLDVQRLSSLVLFRTIEILPSLSRRWWEEDCPRVHSDAVQAFVEKYVSPEILKREMGRIKSATSFGPMTVSASQVSREVIASYVQDDFSLRVLISLPAAFPFRNAEVDCSKTLGVPSSRWKSWSLQITIMLNNQGGTLQDALVLWKENVDKEFEGVEPCPICYSVLHVKTHKLPALECKTCRNRFHFDCLTEWLRSSGKSQCVLCQQPWQGTRVI